MCCSAQSQRCSKGRQIRLKHRSLGLFDSPVLHVVDDRRGRLLQVAGCLIGFLGRSVSDSPLSQGGNGLAGIGVDGPCGHA